MSLGTLISGYVRGLSPANYGEGEGLLAITNRGDLLVAQGISPKASMVRLGDSWSCQIATGSAFTHVAGMPTTRAELVLYNGEPSTGKSYIIDSAWWFALTSITAASGGTLISQVAAAAAPTDDVAQLINSPIGKVYGGRAKRAVAATTMTANKWSVLNSMQAGAAVSIGVGLQAEVNGGIILPPGATLGLNVVVGTAIGTGLIGVSWHEAQLRIN